ncbi:MAG: hypothetical protein ACQEUM_07230 [Pseudomonadota bacterium]
MGDIKQFKRMESVTPHGETVGNRFEKRIQDAIQEAENDGLCYGLMIASLAQCQWWMHQRCQEDG